MVRRIGIDARKLGDGGIGRYVRELLRGAPERLAGFELVALARPADAARIGELAPSVRVVAATSSGYSLLEHLELARLAAREGLDLLHVPHYVVPAAARCPLIATVHDLIHIQLPRSALHAAYARAMLALVRRRASAVLVPSAAVAHDLVELASFEPSRVRVVPNGVAAEFLLAGPPPRQQVEAFVARRGLRPPYVLNVTNGLPHKGLDLLLGALADLPGLQLALVGRGSERPGERCPPGGASLPTEAVLRLGELDDTELRLAYAGAAAVVVASRLEGFGLPALEAMAVGAPVLATRAGALPEVVGDAALLVSPGSVACLRDGLYRMAFDIEQTERERLIQRGLARARRFPWERSIEATCAAYEQVLAGAA